MDGGHTHRYNYKMIAKLCKQNMKSGIIFLKPIFKEMIWGGSRLSEFGYDIPSEKTGECWAISAHTNGDCVIDGENFEGKTLSELWCNHRELFGNAEGDQFPLLIKIIDANEDLSIQVHPDDNYAKNNENGSLGKTECWYILDCKEEATIVIGHNAKDKSELEEMINNHKWGEFIREVPINKGDFFQINPGCLHAIKGGTLILETQQNSDITYRVYDYDRLQNGNPRQLHIRQSIDVIDAPYTPVEFRKEIKKYDNMIREKLISCNYYTVEKIDISGRAKLLQPYKFMNISVIDGYGSVDGMLVKKGTHFIIPYNYGSVQLDGNLSMIISYI